MRDSGRIEFWGLLTAAVALMGLTAATFLVPLSWTAYARYIIAMFGMPLVAAVLTAAVVLVVALFAMRRRRTSGFVAAGIFFSIVLHMVIVSIFGMLVIKNTIAPYVLVETKQEISIGLPSLVESLLSQEVRTKFMDSEVPENRKLEIERKTKRDTAERKLVKPKPEIKPVESPRAPVPEKMKPVPASEPRLRVKEILADIPTKIPDVNQAPMAIPKPAQTVRETTRQSAVKQQEFKTERAQSTRLDTPAVPAASIHQAPLKESRRDPLRDKNPELAAIEHNDLKVVDAMRGANRTGKTDDMKLPAGKMNPALQPVAAKAQEAKEKPLTFEIARQQTTASDAPAPRKSRRTMVAETSSSASASLADATPMRMERQRVVADSELRTDAGGRRSLGEPVRLQDAAASAAQQASSGEAAAPAVSASPRANLEPGRTISPAAGAEQQIAQPRASLDLQAKPAGAQKYFSTHSGASSPAAQSRSMVQERLQSASTRESLDRTLVDVGGNAAILPTADRSASANPAGRMNGTAGNLEPVRVEAGEFAAADARADGPAGPAVDLVAGSASVSRETGVRIATDVPGVRSHKEVAVGGEKLASSSTGIGTPSQFSVAVGDEPVAVATPGGTDAPFMESGMTKYEGRQSLSTGGHRTGMVTSGEDLPRVQHSIQVETVSGGGEEHASLAGGGAVAVPGAGTRQTTGVRDSPEIGAAGLIDAVISADGTIIASAVGAIPAESAVNGAHTDAAGDIRSAQAGKTMPVGKASARDDHPETGDHPTWKAAGVIGRAAQDTSSMAGPGDISGGASMDLRTPGVGRDVTVGRVSGTSAVMGDTVALRMSAREATGAPDAADAASSAEATAGGRQDVRVAKAGGAVFGDKDMAGAVSSYDSPGMESSASRPPARLELDFAESGETKAGVSSDIAAGTSANESQKLLISAELSSVPESVPEKAIYKLRAPERRREFIKELGGSEKTEQAVEKALVWLAQAQSDDGRWDIDGFKNLSRCGGAGDRKDDDVALTGLCLLAYFGAGYTHVKGIHKETVRKALNWLVVGQKPDGDIQRGGQMYGQAMATAALCEGYSMTGDQRLREPAERAIDFILQAQNPEAGWRYQPRRDSDTSVTGWQVLALKSAMIAGIKIPAKHFRWVEMWLDKVRRGSDGGLYTYMPGHGATPVMTAEGWFCQLLMGEQTRTRGQAETIPYLMRYLPVWSAREQTVNLYYWYYATLALHLSGAAEFDQWNKALTRALLEGQVTRGPAAGSWDPVCQLGERGGRVYSTTAAALCLEVYYRYLPFYKQK